MTPKAADVREQVFTLLKKIYPWSQPVSCDVSGKWWPCRIKMQDSQCGCALELCFVDTVRYATDGSRVRFVEIHAIYANGDTYKLTNDSYYTRVNGAIKAPMWAKIQKEVVKHCGKIPFHDALEEMGLLKHVRATRKTSRRASK